MNQEWLGWTMKEVRQITVHHGELARDAGTCNACDDQIDHRGIKEGARVTLIRLKYREFKLCSSCKSVLQSLL